MVRGTRQSSRKRAGRERSRSTNRRSPSSSRNQRRYIHCRSHTRHKTRSRTRRQNDWRKQKDDTTDSDSYESDYTDESSTDEDRTDSDDDYYDTIELPSASFSQLPTSNEVIRPGTNNDSVETDGQESCRNKRSGRRHGTRGRRQRRHDDEEWYYPEESLHAGNRINNNLQLSDHNATRRRNTDQAPIISPISPLIQTYDVNHPMAWDTRNNLRVTVQPRLTQQSPTEQYDPDSRYDRANRELHSVPVPAIQRPPTRRGLPNGSQQNINFNLSQHLAQQIREYAIQINAPQQDNFIVQQTFSSVTVSQSPESDPGGITSVIPRIIPTHSSFRERNSHGGHNSRREDYNARAAGSSNSQTSRHYVISGSDEWNSDIDSRSRSPHRGNRRNTQRERVSEQQRRWDQDARFPTVSSHNVRRTDTHADNTRNPSSHEITTYNGTVTPLPRHSSTATPNTHSTESILAIAPQADRQETDSNPFSRFDASFRRQDDRNREWRERRRRRQNRQERQEMESRRLNRRLRNSGSSSSSAEDLNTTEPPAASLIPFRNPQPAFAVLHPVRPQLDTFRVQRRESDTYDMQSNNLFPSENSEGGMNRAVTSQQDDAEDRAAAELRDYKDPAESDSTVGQFLRDVTARGGVLISRRRKRITKQYFRSGDFQIALADFRALQPEHIRQVVRVGFTGTVANMYRLTVRQKSSFGEPTFEIRPMNKRIRKKKVHVCYKIRYIARSRQPRRGPAIETEV